MTNGWPRRAAIAATSLAAIACVAVFVVALVPSYPCNLFEHFRVQYVAGGVLVIGAAAVLRLRGYLDAAVIATLLELLVITPDLTASRGPLPASGRPLRVLVLNVRTENTSYAEVRRLIDDVHPDLVALVEVDRRWLDEIAPSLTTYAGRVEAPRDDHSGLAVYARTPLTATVEELGGGLPTVVASTSGIHLIATHPYPPMNGAARALQLSQLDAIAVRARDLSGPVLVMGDLNATPWSRAFRRLLIASGLCDSRAGFGLQASFPADSAILRIPIDHVLVSCSVGVADRHIERDVGSDHLPVVVDLVLPR